MRTIECVDCSAEVKKTRTQKRCIPCQAVFDLSRRIVQRKTYHVEHLEKRCAQSKSSNAAHRERRSLGSHHYFIFKSKGPKHRTYRNMPFFDEWNPDKGGSFEAGANWLIEHLGKIPKGGSLGIIHHDLGVIPGNICWSDPRKQASNRMFRVLGEQRATIAELKRYVVELEKTAWLPLFAF